MENESREERKMTHIDDSVQTLVGRVQTQGRKTGLGWRGLVGHISQDTADYHGSQ